MTKTSHSAILVALLLCSGCASTSNFRGLASKTGAIVSTLREGTADFVEDQNALNVDNASRLDRLQAEAEQRELRARQQELALKSGGRDTLLAAYQAATALSPANIVLRLHEGPKRHSAIGDGGAGDAYSGTEENLEKLAAKPSLLSSLAGFLAYARQVHEAYDKKKEEAAQAAAATAPEAATQDEAIISSPD